MASQILSPIFRSTSRKAFRLAANSSAALHRFGATPQSFNAINSGGRSGRAISRSMQSSSSSSASAFSLMRQHSSIDTAVLVDKKRHFISLIGEKIVDANIGEKILPKKSSSSIKPLPERNVSTSSTLSALFNGEILDHTINKSDQKHRNHNENYRLERNHFNSIFFCKSNPFSFELIPLANSNNSLASRRFFSTTSNSNPEKMATKVFFDIDVDGSPAGRIVMEVSDIS